MGYGCGMESLVESYEDEIFGLLGIDTGRVSQFWTDMADASDEIKEVVSRESSISGGATEKEKLVQAAGAA
jgi:hypothetical protein